MQGRDLPWEGGGEPDPRSIRTEPARGLQEYFPSSVSFSKAASSPSPALPGKLPFPRMFPGHGQGFGKPVWHPLGGLCL